MVCILQDQSPLSSTPRVCLHHWKYSTYGVFVLQIITWHMICNNTCTMKYQTDKETPQGQGQGQGYRGDFAYCRKSSKTDKRVSYHKTTETLKAYHASTSDTEQKRVLRARFHNARKAKRFRSGTWKPLAAKASTLKAQVIPASNGDTLRTIKVSGTDKAKHRHSSLLEASTSSSPENSLCDLGLVAETDKKRK